MTLESTPLSVILVVTAALSVACAGPEGRPGGGFGGGGGVPVATTTGDFAESSSVGSSSENASDDDPPTTAGENPEFTTDADPDTGEAEPESICGDEILQDGEECDEGPDNSDAGACMTNCAQAVCGDGLVRVGVEGCDDGNLVDDDACTNLCALASCGDGVLQPGEACDDGDLDDTDACTSVCAHAVCGDAIVQVGEQCDEGPANADNAGCTGACEVAACGDGLLYEGAEQCDDGAPVEGDGCTADCQIEPASCDPLVQDCEPYEVCIFKPDYDGFECRLDASGDEGQQHDPCESDNACDPGLLCVNPEAAVECDQNFVGCCVSFCDPSAPDPEAKCGGDGQVCELLTEDVGICWYMP